MTASRPPARVRWFLGTMGYAYPDWLGPFFPAGLAQSKWLGEYARRFNAVELNTTFYAIPTEARCAAWAAGVPESFRFSVKVSRQITHDTPLPDAGPLLDSFCRAVRGFGDRLGCVLLQFPPTLTIAAWPELQRLLDRLPGDLPAAVEFRHLSWLADEPWQALRARGIAWVGLDHDDHPPLAVVRPTGRLLYLRLVGKHGRYEREDREVFDPTELLTWWWEQLSRTDWTGIDAAWVLFNNDYAGHAPATLRRFAALAGIALPAGPVRQRSLFEDDP